MRWIISGLFVLSLVTELSAAEPPLVEKYLHTGELARGEQVLESALAAAPHDDQVRFSLGLLQVVRGVERLGQSLYEHGLTESDMVFLRLPLAKNPDPTPISYRSFLRVLDGFRSDLAKAEATLAAVSDEEVKLSLRLTDIHMDLDGDRTAESTLGDIVKKLGGSRFRFPENNPEFQVSLDRGDVAWLRAYCHLLMSIIDIHGTIDGQQSFDLITSTQFANPKVKFKRKDFGDWTEIQDLWSVLVVKDPARLGSARKHLLAVCDLNHETWRYIRSERDDDHEWLPNSKQKGVIGLPVSDEMVDTWLVVIDEFKGLLNGKKRFSPILVQFVTSKQDPRGLSLKELLDNPPDKFDWKKIQTDGIDEKYLVRDGVDVDISKIFRFGQVFNNSLAVGYAMWFN